MCAVRIYAHVATVSWCIATFGFNIAAQTTIIRVDLAQHYGYERWRKVLRGLSFAPPFAYLTCNPCQPMSEVIAIRTLSRLAPTRPSCESRSRGVLTTEFG